MDCLSLPNDGQYNCTRLWGTNCTNKIGFDFDSMWAITELIQQYCPTDSRLFLQDNIPAIAANAALKGPICKAIAGSTWQLYPPADTWVRLTTWKFPLLQLIASSPRPPLGVTVEGFVILHLLGDPVGTIKDLLCVISSCQERADYWRTYLAEPQPGKRQLDSVQIDHAWKAFTIISISYDEWGRGDKVQSILTDSLEALTAKQGSDADLQNFLKLCNLTADALAADRSTKFLPIIVAQGFFVGAIGVAIAKITANPFSTSFFINVEAHSIAFSALYFWILPAVFLSSVIGVSQTRNAVPRILRCFQDGINHELPKAGIAFPNDVLNEKQTRVLSGGIYSWQPDREDVNESQSDHEEPDQKDVKGLNQVLPRLQRVESPLRNVLPLTIVVAGTLTAWLVSSSVPPDGWEPRLCAQTMILLTWLLSYSFTSLLKRNTSSPSYNDKGRFWLTFSKDILATTATMGGVVVTQLGLFNRCDSYTRWDRTGLALPGEPDIAAILAHRIGTVYPAIVFTSIGLQMFAIPVIIAIWYRHALLVFMQRDDEHSSPLWFLEWRWLRRNRSSTPKRQRPQRYESDPECLAAQVTSDNRTPFTANAGKDFEEVELHSGMQFAPHDRTHFETIGLRHGRDGDHQQRQHQPDGNENAEDQDFRMYTTQPNSIGIAERDWTALHQHSIRDTTGGGRTPTIP